MRLLLAIAALLAMPAFGKERAWRAANVIYQRHELNRGDNVAGEGSGNIQSARERLTLSSSDGVYTIEQWVVPSQMLRLEPGTPVRFAVEGKKVVVKTLDGRVRKLKLVER